MALPEWPRPPSPHRRLGTGLRVAAAKRLCVPDRTPWTSRWWLRERRAPRRQRHSPSLPRCIRKSDHKEKKKKRHIRENATREAWAGSPAGNREASRSIPEQNALGNQGSGSGTWAAPRRQGAYAHACRGALPLCRQSPEQEAWGRERTQLPVGTEGDCCSQFSRIRGMSGESSAYVLYPFHVRVNTLLIP